LGNDLEDETMTDGNDQEKQTILLVDDTPESLALTSSVLSDLYKIKIAANGKKALQIAYSQDPPDLILLDIMMPEMDGYEVCRQLKNDSQTADIPVIFLTAKSDVDDETKGFELGAVDYITKPISPPIVLARVRTHLRLKRVTDYLRNRLGENEPR
jgi:putative two-component system response regulator